MTIHRLLQNSPLGPDEIASIVAAYEATLKALGLRDRNDPMTHLVAKKIIELRQRGVRDAAELARRAIEAFGPAS
jgi:hypothetical protein